jgi:endonuclease/exonuclease/phosphatase family metal-dependent hydrolase
VFSSGEWLPFNLASDHRYDKPAGVAPAKVTDTLQKESGMRSIVVAVLLALIGTVPADDKSGPKALRVLTYNIHHGEGTDGKLDLPRIAEIIKAAKPDLVALQEVDRNTTRTGKVDQTAELAKLTGLNAEFGKAIDLQGGGYGLAVLSRFPLKGTKTHPLPGKEKQEARIVMQTTVEPGGFPAITFLNTHLQHDDGPTREKQVAKIDELFGAAEGTFILTGDLNAAPGSAPIKALAKNWAFATEPGGKGLFTIPSDVPKQQIDYVLFRGKFKVIEAKVIEEKVASDHRPVLAVVEWSGR